MEVTGRLCLCTREGSTKQWVEPESISADIIGAGSEIAEDVKETRSELGSERAEVLSQTTSEVAQGGSTQSLACAEAGGLLSLFDSGEVSFSLACAVWALALAADEVDFRQSLAV